MSKEFEIEINSELANRVREFLKNNKNLGYESIDDFGEHALRCFIIRCCFLQHPPHSVEEVAELQH